MGVDTESKTQLEDQRNQYKKLIGSLQHVSLPMADVKSGRTLRMQKFKANFRASLKESKFTFMYGMAVGGISGFILSLPSFIKTRSFLIPIVSSVSMGLFFGLLVTVSSIMGKLDGPEGHKDFEPYLKYRKIPLAWNPYTSTQILTSQTPYWLTADFTNPTFNQDRKSA